jgi:hypothetical protein
MSIYTIINPTMNLLLHSPWHQLLSKRIMTVSYSGRKTGKHYKIPISYYLNGNTVYCFTNGGWRHNFKTQLAATLRIAGRDFPAKGKLFVDDRETQVGIMSAYFKAVPQDRKFYGVKCDAQGEPNRSQVEHALGSIVIIKFKLQ